jgi:hypothetical protein
VNELKKTIQDINEKFNQKIFLKEKSWKWKAHKSIF